MVHVPCGVHMQHSSFCHDHHTIQPNSTQCIDACVLFTHQCFVPLWGKHLLPAAFSYGSTNAGAAAINQYASFQLCEHDPSAHLSMGKCVLDGPTWHWQYHQYTTHPAVLIISHISTVLLNLLRCSCGSPLFVWSWASWLATLFINYVSLLLDTIPDLLLTLMQL